MTRQSNNRTIEQSNHSPVPCCLTIAGSDSGGNAGVQADLRTFHAYGIHGCTAFAALTAQNPFGVSAIHAVPPDFVAAQLDAVLDVYRIRALKTGMLATADVIEAVADRLASRPEIAKVIDPVMVATSGARLIDGSAIDVLKAKLLPLATVITPNIPEAEVLSGRSITSRAEVREAARRLNGEYGSAVLVKGGHAVGDLAAAEDTLFDGSDFSAYTMPWIDRPVSTHGTGCSLAAALAAELALGRALPEAVAGAKRYVHDAIASSYFVGPDCGVLGWARRHQPEVPSATFSDDARTVGTSV